MLPGKAAAERGRLEPVSPGVPGALPALRAPMRSAWRHAHVPGN